MKCKHKHVERAVECPSTDVVSVNWEGLRRFMGWHGSIEELKRVRLDGPPKCAHKTWQCYTWNGFWEEAPFVAKRDADMVLCESCGEWLPLGPSTDTGPHAEAVAIELRAAELAADLDEADRLCDWTMGNDSFVSATAFDERRGWALSDPNTLMYSTAWLVGYLARCIATHDTALSADGRMGEGR